MQAPEPEPMTVARSKASIQDAPAPGITPKSAPEQRTNESEPAPAADAKDEKNADAKDENNADSKGDEEMKQAETSNVEQPPAVDATDGNTENTGDSNVAEPPASG